MSELLSLAVTLPPDTTLPDAVHLARLAGRLGFSAIHVHPDHLPAGQDVLTALSEAAESALIVLDDGTEALGIVRRNDPDEVSRCRALLEAEGATRPLVVAVPISIGRTLNEAVARADLEPRFVGDRHPRRTGIFGTFEQAQEQVLALARAGADGLVLDIPIERDVADVLAQVKALVVGATPALRSRLAREDTTGADRPGRD